MERSSRRTLIAYPIPPFICPKSFLVTSKHLETGSAARRESPYLSASVIERTMSVSSRTDLWLKQSFVNQTPAEHDKTMANIIAGKSGRK